MSDTSSETIKNHASFIWSLADLLRGDYKQSEYGKVVLPLTVLRRFDCVAAGDRRPPQRSTPSLTACRPPECRFVVSFG